MCLVAPARRHANPDVLQPEHRRAVYETAHPGNRLEALSGDRKGQYSIRINEQYRICFKWIEMGPDEVELIDYH
ncbi:type II toxin-antitoxin system RelE/ParE family toxin [Nitrosomonas sp.]|uniref:type II toxin-antitoxin system RelE/ParE family toxin n=1 Tax=Nitrosomonas sp. TaxID=42353 RepID=UPI003F8E06F7|nr:type II toxin-antitoxin system RelE/ParE family toxin [Burkholderiales bacterium]